MSIEAHRCYVLACDSCSNVYDENNAGYIRHFDTPDEALHHATDWDLDENGNIVCPRCSREQCARLGHAFSIWHPCACKGSFADHAHKGCGLFRICQRLGCESYETTTLAKLPVTDEPTRPGR